VDNSRRDILKLLACGAALCPMMAGGRALSGENKLHQALYWEPQKDQKIKCLLCPRQCIVADKERGTCGVRENNGGIYYTLVHSRPCSLNIDPIEKKPLFHFKPGSEAFSLATAGCNIECRFCQNWEISQFRPEQISSKSVSPKEVVRHAQRLGASSIAFTYSEPVIFYEYMLDICKAAEGSGVGRIMISNGYINLKPLAQLLPHLDGIKIDFKAFSESFYKNICSAHLRPVLETLINIKKAGIWLELVVLTIPTLNDSPREIEAMSRWIVKYLGPDVPIHFTRFHPMYKIKNLPPTPVKTLEHARKIAMNAGIHFAYAGNIPGHPGENTYCHKCGASIIVRTGYQISSNNLVDGRCPKCKTPLAGIWK